MGYDFSLPGVYRTAAAANQDAAVLKASQGRLRSLVVINTNAAVRYLKLYDKATAPTSADTPVQVFAVPGNTAGAGIALPVPPDGILFGSGIGVRVTTGLSDADTGAAASGEVVASYSFS